MELVWTLSSVQREPASKGCSCSSWTKRGVGRPPEVVRYNAEPLRPPCATGSCTRSESWSASCVLPAALKIPDVRVSTDERCDDDDDDDDDDSPFSDELPDHTDSDAASEHRVERWVTGCDHFAVAVHDVSQRHGLAAQGKRDGIDDLSHSLRRQPASLRNIKEGKQEHIRDGDEAGCVRGTITCFLSCRGPGQDARTLSQCRVLAGGYPGYRR